MRLSLVIKADRGRRAATVVRTAGVVELSNLTTPAMYELIDGEL